MTSAWAPPEVWTTAVIALGVVSGVIRLLLRRRSAAPDARGPRWRLGLLAALQITSGVLLHLLLFPPSVSTRTGTLVVAAAGAPSTIPVRPGEALVALPEAGAVEGAARVPDLATALRRFPGAGKVRLEGGSLTPRDQRPISAALQFEPPPRPRGLIEIAFPEPTAPGGRFTVGGQVGTLPRGLVELLDPAGAVAARVPVAAGQRFAMSAYTRAPGLALFTLRLRDAAGAVVEQVAAPVEARVQAPPRVLVLSGAPDAEIKYLRRWAEDAGIPLDVRIELGGGVQLADAPARSGASDFGEADLVVVDERRWETLGGGERAALASAVNGGLGLLLRPTGPLPDAVRRDWAALGAPLTGGTESRPVRLAPAEAARPVAGEQPVGDPADALPELTALDIAPQGSGAISLLRDAGGAPFASWRARGQGRVGVWTLTDSYALVLTGRPDRYGELWSEVLSTLARAGEDSRARVDGFPRAGARVAICGVSGAASVLGPDGAARALRVDPATGAENCAAYWPDGEGWRLIRDGGRRETAFYVHPANAAPSLVAAADRRATLALTATPAARAQAQAPERAPQRAAGSSWPWFSLLLAALAGLWWLERNLPSPGRRPSTPAG